MSALLARAGRGLLVGALLVAEPVLHALGVPHPEGLAAFAVQVASTR